jgi:hypothetical protein
MNLPPCPNFLEKRCVRSDVFIEKETDTGFSFRCRTCKCLNIWPKDHAEQAGKYEAFLKHKALEQQQQEFFRRKREYSGA